MRVHNFSAGPSALPLVALERAREELTDYAGSGMSIMEQSHRGAVYDKVHEEALGLLRELMQVPTTHEILLLTGGATTQFAQVPLNLRHPDQSADYAVAGIWGQKALKEAQHGGKARAAASSETPEGGFFSVPELSSYQIDPQAAFLHVTSNNTVTGTQMKSFPHSEVPLVCDMSSDILSRSIDINQFGLIYAGAQKNLGPSGVTVVIVRKSLIESARKDIPFIWQYRTQAAARSLANTAPTFSIYMLRNVLDWVKSQGGATQMALLNQQKADLLYSTLESRPDVFKLKVERDSRSMMNVVWNLATPELEKRAVAEATAAQMVGLKGHRLVGGMRASIYNAVPMASVEVLCEFLMSFKA